MESKPQLYKAEVIKRTKIGSRFYTYVLKLQNPKEISFKAGQYIAITVAKGTKRFYSIASSPTNTREIEISVDVSPHGLGSNYFENLKEGELVEFFGPLGVFTLDKVDPESEYIFIATGCGVTPLKSQILYLLENNVPNKVTLYFGTRYENELIYKDLFESMEKENPNFKYTVAVSRPRPDYSGDVGYVTKFLDQNIKSNKKKQVFMCGNPDVRESVISVLKEKGFKEDQIHMEKFY